MKILGILSLLLAQILLLSLIDEVKSEAFEDLDEKPDLPEVCQLPSEAGTCVTMERRWFYDAKLKRCRTFVWSGCGGNGNNFRYRGVCERICLGNVSSLNLHTTTRFPRPKRPTHPIKRRTTLIPTTSNPECHLLCRTRCPPGERPIKYLDSNGCNVCACEQIIVKAASASSLLGGMSNEGQVNPPSAANLEKFTGIMAEVMNHTGAEGADELVIGVHGSEDYVLKREFPVSSDVIHPPFSSSLEFGPVFLKFGSRDTPAEEAQSDVDEATKSAGSFTGNEGSHAVETTPSANAKVTISTTTLERPARDSEAEPYDPILISSDLRPREVPIDPTWFLSQSGRSTGSSLLLGGMSPHCSGKERPCRNSCVLKNYMTDENGCQICRCDDPEKPNKNFRFLYIDDAIVKARRMLCSQPPFRGPCSNKLTRWHYDPTIGGCKTFEYGGCRGNENNFYSQESCMEYCTATADDARTDRQKWYKTILGLLKKK